MLPAKKKKIIYTYVKQVLNKQEDNLANKVKSSGYNQTWLHFFRKITKQLDWTINIMPSLALKYVTILPTATILLFYF
jgi:hypothetical protein